MAGELVTQLNAGDFFRESSLGYDQASFAAPVGSLRGVSLNKFQSAAGTINEYYNSMVYIPSNLTISTGLTFKFTIVDDGTSAADLGTAVKLGISVKKLNGSGTITLDTGSGTEQTATATLNSTSGIATTGTIAIANANLNGAGTGDTIAFRIRRLGADAADTCPGRVILLIGHINNT